MKSRRTLSFANSPIWALIRLIKNQEYEKASLEFIKTKFLILGRCAQTEAKDGVGVLGDESINDERV
jgi:hypothetical protein